MSKLKGVMLTMDAQFLADQIAIVCRASIEETLDFHINNKKSFDVDEVSKKFSIRFVKKLLKKNGI